MAVKCSLGSQAEVIHSLICKSGDEGTSLGQRLTFESQKTGGLSEATQLGEAHCGSE